MFVELVNFTIQEKKPYVSINTTTSPFEIWLSQSNQIRIQQYSGDRTISLSPLYKGPFTNLSNLSDQFKFASLLVMAGKVYPQTGTNIEREPISNIFRSYNYQNTQKDHEGYFGRIR